MRKLVLFLMLLNIFVTGIVLYSVSNNPKLEEVYLNFTSCEYMIDTEFELKAIAIPQKARLVVGEWVSSNEQIATVNQNGRVKAKGVGECVVSVKVNDGEILNCEVKVLPIIASEIQLSVGFATIPIGYTQIVSSQVIPSNTTYQGFKLFKWYFTLPLKST